MTVAVHAETVGNAGLVLTRRVRETGWLVSVYRADAAGIESDPAIPWATVCERHNTVVCHTSRRLAEHHMSAPSGWCLLCHVAVTGLCYCGTGGTHKPAEGGCELADDPEFLYAALADALTAAGLDWRPGSDMVGEHIAVPAAAALVWHPRWNTGGLDIWVITRHFGDNDGAFDVFAEQDIPADAAALDGYAEITVPAGPDVTGLVVALLAKLAAHVHETTPAPAAWFVRRERTEEDDRTGAPTRRVGWVGPIRDSEQAAREVDAWQSCGWEAAAHPDTPQVRQAVAAWEDGTVVSWADSTDPSQRRRFRDREEQRRSRGLGPVGGGR